MGVEPTVACSAQPTTNFEDWGIHRDTYTPTDDYNDGWQKVKLRIVQQSIGALY